MELILGCAFGLLYQKLVNQKKSRNPALFLGANFHTSVTDSFGIGSDSITTSFEGCFEGLLILFAFSFTSGFFSSLIIVLCFFMNIPEVN